MDEAAEFRTFVLAAATGMALLLELGYDCAMMEPSLNIKRKSEDAKKGFGKMKASDDVAWTTEDEWLGRSATDSAEARNHAEHFGLPCAPSSSGNWWAANS